MIRGGGLRLLAVCCLSLLVWRTDALAVVLGLSDRALSAAVRSVVAFSRRCQHPAWPRDTAEQKRLRRQATLVFRRPTQAMQEVRLAAELLAGLETHSIRFVVAFFRELHAVVKVSLCRIEHRLGRLLWCRDLCLSHRNNERKELTATKQTPHRYVSRLRIKRTPGCPPL